MSHAVHFRDRLGAVQLEDVASLEDALHRVEQLRSDEGAADVRVFREVPVEVRTYYRAVVADGDGEVAVPVAEAVPAPAAAEASVPAPMPVVDSLPGATVMSPPSAPRVEQGADGEPATGDEPRRSRFARS